MSRPISVGLVVVLPHELVPELPLELVQEILTLLPVKSLMRCKCVSKIWLSIITDPSFAAVYRGGFRGLLLYDPLYQRLARGWRLVYASLDFEGQPSFQFSGEVIMAHSDFADHRGELMGCTETVNGVLCFYYREYSYLFNPATREKLELPFSTGDASKYKACSYHFGYDPVNKLYKLLKICPVYDDYPAPYLENAHGDIVLEDDNCVPKVDRRLEKDDKDYKKIIFVEKDDRDYKERIFVENLQCEILTIGLDSSWRILPSLPPMEMSSLRSRCMDGVLYWLELDPECHVEIAKHLVAFDLVEEKFQFIATPANSAEGFSMFTFSPGLALISRNKIYHYGDGQWKEQKLTVRPPTTPRSPWPLCPHGILPNGKMLITRLVRFAGAGPCYLYDPTKKTLQHLQDTFSMRIYDALNEGSSYYEENIIPLKCLTEHPRREE